MKKNYTISILLGLCLVLLYAFTTTEKSMKEWLSVLVNGPYLPDEPFNYDIEIPQYVVNGNFWVQQNEASVEGSINNKKATLGRVLFYDRLLSQDYSISCANCHKQAFGFTDNRRFSEGIGGQLATRNTPNINDIAWRLTYEPWAIPFFWDAREDNFHEMVTTPIVAPTEMGLQEVDIIPRLEGVGYYQALFEDAYGEPGIDLAKTREALAQFIRSMTTFDTKYDNVKKGEALFSASEAAGEALFMEQCNTCHTAPHFSVQTPLRNGFPVSNTDLGFGAVTGQNIDNGKFKSPSLRNVAVTAPFLHNGAFDDLGELLKFYSDSISAPGLYYNPNGEAINLAAISLNSTEIGDMIAFLNTLTSENLLTHPKWSNPFLLPSSTGGPLPSQASVRVFPNPVSSTFSLEIIGTDDHEFELEIYGQNGQLASKISFTGKTKTIEKGNLQPGIYLLKIKGEKQTATSQIVVQ